MPIWKEFVKKRNRALISGIAGFAGSFLADLLLSEEYEVCGFLAPHESTENVDHIIREIKLERFDILNREKVSQFIKKTKPDYIYHLAAFSSVGQSFANERMTYDINFTGTLNMLEAATQLREALKKLVFIGSSDAYGVFAPRGKTLTEEQPFNPISPYGISKVAAEYLTQYYRRQYNLPAVVIRAFNHTGPRQNEYFVVPSFCKQIAQIERGHSRPQIMVGDLSARRDIADVRDIVCGYYLAAQKGCSGDVYQLCSGQAVAVRTILDKLLKMATVKIKVNVDKSRFRKSDIPMLKGDNLKAKMQLGWHRRFGLDDTLRDTLQYWRERIKQRTQKR